MKLVCILKLDQESYRFGTVLLFDIQRENQGKQLYGYAQFEKKEDANNLIKTIMIQLITQQGKQLELHLNRNQVKNCYIKLKITRQSQKIIKSNIRTGAHNKLELINKIRPLVSNDTGYPLFFEITWIFKEMAQDNNNTFKVKISFFNMVYRKHLNSRERLILMQYTLRMMLQKSRSKISSHYFGIILVQHQQRL
ncbi:unnamed protein product [Paramecium pentaurelia]|uniref:Uncharacterized protein n=1 Tax=Paramecium pentaurelia TaxID=43138 RepID=A0A8S1WVW2_9CILI|nr:unnamed protein product [Paramecium pentaurelia]